MCIPVPDQNWAPHVCEIKTSTVEQTSQLEHAKVWNPLTAGTALLCAALVDK